MNEEISVTLTNNTNQIQPVSLFTEPFAIPNNLNSYGFWDISAESFFFGSAPQVAQIVINNVTYSPALPTLDADGLVSALNSLGLGTFTNTNNIISVIPPSDNFTYTNLTLTPNFNVNVFSVVPNFFDAIFILPPALLQIPSGTTTTANLYYGASQVVNQLITVNYSAGVTATSWNLSINWYQPNGIVTNIFQNNGVGFVLTNTSFIYPSVGNIGITYVLT